MLAEAAVFQPPSSARRVVLTLLESVYVPRHTEDDGNLWHSLKAVPGQRQHAQLGLRQGSFTHDGDWQRTML